MPAFRGKVPDHQAMQLAAYVRSMSGQLRMDVAPGRSDHLRAKLPEALTEELAPRDRPCHRRRWGPNEDGRALPACAIGLLGAGCSGIQSALDPAGPDAARIGDLW